MGVNSDVHQTPTYFERTTIIIIVRMDIITRMYVKSILLSQNKTQFLIVKLLSCQ